MFIVKFLSIPSNSFSSLPAVRRYHRGTMKFTDRYLQSLKPKEKDYRVREGHGFAVRVLPSGVKRFEYIYTINGKRRILHLGNYPATKLADARQAFHNATTLTNKRLDPREKQAPRPP